MQRRSFLKLASAVAAPWPSSADQNGNGRTLTIDEQILVPDDGLLLGNGDLSASVYQKSNQIVWRLGKGDVWDRRLDFSEDPKPAHSDEIAHGIQVEGWKCAPYVG